MDILKTDEYTKLIIIQYKNKEKAYKTIKLFVKELFANDIYFKVQDAFNLETAIGVQLDILGKYVGIDRFYKGQDLEGEDFFSMTNYDDDPAQKGFSDYSNYESKSGRFLIYANILSNNLKLNDDDFRFLIKLKIIQNSIDHSHKTIDESIKDFFGSDIIPSSKLNMTMDYFIPSDASELINVAIEKNILPRPMGVGLSVLIKKQQSKMFGFTDYNSTLQSSIATGFSTYLDFDSKEGEMLNYDKII